MSRLLALLEKRLAEGFELRRWHDGATETVPLPLVSLAEHGAYRLARQPSVPELWASLLAARRQGATLVLLPACTFAEEVALLRQLPGVPPPGAAVALFTSGTTGASKAVFHGEESLLASASQLAAAFPESAPSACLLLPWSMAGLIFHCLLPAASRAPAAYFSAEPFHAWCPHAATMFREAGIGHVTLNPFLLEMFLRSSASPEWQGQAVSLTAPLKPALALAYAERAGRPVREIYGMTESAGPLLLDGKTLGARTRIAGGSAEGELETSGRQLLLGFGAEGAFEAAPEWFATGDVFREEDGRLRHVARTRELIDLGGRKLAPRLVEEVLERAPWLAECLVFPVELGGVERPGLLYVRKSGCAMSSEELALAVEGYLHRELSPELRPRWWGEVDALPRGKTGKPDRRQAIGLYRQRAAGG